MENPIVSRSEQRIAERKKVIKADNILFGVCFVVIVTIFLILTFFR